MFANRFKYMELNYDQKYLNPTTGKKAEYLE